MNTNTKTEIKPALASDEKKNKIYSWMCIAVFFVITVVTFGNFLFAPPDMMTTSSDQMAAIGSRVFTNDAFDKHGQVPMWLSPRLSGMPTIDAKFGDIFYPISFFLRPLVSAHQYHSYSMIIHVFLAGVFFFLMMRRSFGAPHLVAFAGATFYMLCPQFVSHVQPGHDGKMFVIAWLPVVVWTLRSMLAAPTVRNAALFALGVGMTVLSGHVQMAYFVLMGIFLYWVTDIVYGIKVNKDGAKTVALKTAFFWCGVFVGLGVSFIQLWPAYLFVRDAHSVRGVDRGFEFATSWSMHWAEFFSLWVHEFGNALQYYWGKNQFKLNTEYAGLVPLLLTVLAVASKPKSVWRWLWAGIAVLAVIFAMGANTPFFTLFYYVIPGVRRFRAPSMIMFWFSFCTVLMAVLFIKDIATKRFENLSPVSLKKWTKGLLIAIGGITLITLLFSSQSIATSFAMPMMHDMVPRLAMQAPHTFAANFSQNFVPSLWLWWFFVAVILFMLYLLIGGKLKVKTFVCALIIINVIDMARVNAQFINVESVHRSFYQNDPTLNELKAEFDVTPFRVFPLASTLRAAGPMGRDFNVFAPFMTQNQAGAYGLEEVGGFHDNELNFYRAFRELGDFNFMQDITTYVRRDTNVIPYMDLSKLRGNTPFLDLANVETILFTTEDSPIVQQRRNPTNLGRVSFAPNYVVMENDTLVLTSLMHRLHDYRTTVMLDEEPTLPFERKLPVLSGDNVDVVDNGEVESDNVDVAENNADDSDTSNIAQAENVANVNREETKKFAATWKKYSPNVRIVNVVMPDDGFLRISEVYYPGWEILVNGEPTKYYRADVTWMAVPLKAGEYEITMTVRSLYLTESIWITVISSLVVIAALAYAFIAKRKNKK